MIWGHQHPVDANTSLGRFEDRTTMSYKLYPIMDKIFGADRLYGNPPSVSEHQRTSGQTVLNQLATVDVNQPGLIFVLPRFERLTVLVLHPTVKLRVADVQPAGQLDAFVPLDQCNAFAPEPHGLVAVHGFDCCLPCPP
jgi:hypothetical protein